jgi:hypothetical protein
MCNNFKNIDINNKFQDWIGLNVLIILKAID